jgi:hypothetical protein
MAVAASVGSVLRAAPSSRCEGRTPAPSPSARWIASWATRRTTVVPHGRCPHASTAATATAGSTSAGEAHSSPPADRLPTALGGDAPTAQSPRDGVRQGVPAGGAGHSGQVQARPYRGHSSQSVRRRPERPATTQIPRPRAAEIETEDVFHNEYMPARVPTAEAVARMRQELRDAALRARRKSEKVFTSPCLYTALSPTMPQTLKRRRLCRDWKLRSAQQKTRPYRRPGCPSRTPCGSSSSSSSGGGERVGRGSQRRGCAQGAERRASATAADRRILPTPPRTEATRRRRRRRRW